MEREETQYNEVGRFQAIQMGNIGAFIIDTKQGHYWVWAMGRTGGTLTYGGQVSAKPRPGETVYQVPFKK
jgi:hypothetical protein